MFGVDIWRCFCCIFSVGFALFFVVSDITGAGAGAGPGAGAGSVLLENAGFLHLYPKLPHACCVATHVSSQQSPLSHWSTSLLWQLSHLPSPFQRSLHACVVTMQSRKQHNANTTTTTSACRFFAGVGIVAGRSRGEAAGLPGYSSSHYREPICSPVPL